MNLHFRKKKEKKRKIAQGRKRECGGTSFRVFRRLLVGLLSFAVGVFAAKVIKAAAKYIFGFANSPFLSAGRNFFWLFEKWKLCPQSTRTSANELRENIPEVRFSLLMPSLCDCVTLKWNETIFTRNCTVIDVRLILQKILCVCLYVAICIIDSANESMRSKCNKAWISWIQCNVVMKYANDT